MSELIEPMLARLDDDVDPDADSIHDAIDRVRDTYRREATLEAEQTIAAAQAEIQQTRRASEESIARAEAEARVAQESARAALARNEAVVGAIETRVRRRADIVASILFWTLVALLAAAGVLSIPGVFDVVGATAKIISRIVIAVGVVFGIAGAVKGTTVTQVRANVSNSIAARLRRRWLATGISDETT